MIRKIVFLILIILFTGCATKQISLEKNSDMNNTNSLLNKKNNNINNNKNLLSKKEICESKSETIKRWELNYQNTLLDEILNLDELMNFYNAFNESLDELNITNCNNLNKNEIKYNIFILTKPYIVRFFLKTQINEFHKLQIDVFKDFDNLIESKYKEEIVEISNSYGDEMNSLTPFTSDEEIWEEKLNTPFNNMLKNINNDFIQLSDKRQIEFLVQIYNNFIVFANKYNLYYKRTEIPNFTSFSMYDNDYTPEDYGIDKSEEGALWNSFVDIVEWTPIVGDAISLGELVGLDLKSDKNTQKAFKYISNNLKSFKEEKIRMFNNDIKNEIEFLNNYYNNLLIYKE